MSSSISRRSLLGILASAAGAASLSSLFPPHARSQDPPAKPKTNIADAAKHPRTPLSLPGKYAGRAILARNEKAWANGAPDVAALDRMIEAALLSLTGASTLHAAWREFVTPEDVIGLKVNPVAGKLLSTSPEIVHVIIGQLERSGIPRKNIVIWDRREFELHETGFTPEAFPGVRITGTERKDSSGSFRDKEGRLYSESVIDRDWSYWADVEEKYDEETFPYMVNEGKHSYFTGICTKEVTRIINVPILKNAGSSVTLCMKNLAYGAITNTSRLHKMLWHETCAEVPAFAPLRDKVVLNIVDGIKGCYQGGPAANPQFITTFHTVLAGSDPVALDRIGYDIILKKRLEEKIQKEENPKARTFMDMAQALGLGTADKEKIDVETL
jgi:uncharacterized protein (DUF362 family)